MHKSLWQDENAIAKESIVKGNFKTDVLIIGGGISGILCAYFLKEAGVDCIIAEAKETFSGISENTTAKLTIGHGMIYDNMLRELGREKTTMYLKANSDALKEYERLCQSIDCDYEKRDMFVYTTTKKEKAENETRALQSLGYSCEYTEKTELPIKALAAVKIFEQAQINPVKFAKEIAKKLNIIENCFIKEIKGNTAIAENFTIEAEKIIVATHFPFINKHGGYFLKMYQHRSYVCAYENAPIFKGMYVDEDISGFSFRSYGNFLIAGGGGHRTGKDGTAWREIEKFIKTHYPEAKKKFSWAAQDCMTLDGIPYIGKYSKNTPGLYVICGFNKWGFTSSMAGAKIICDLILKKENPYAQIFSPQRSIFKPQLFINGFESTKNLLYPSLKRCPHLGCVLKWNKYEHSWDCPCHGSRFSEKGEIIDNPAMRNADI